MQNVQVVSRPKCHVLSSGGPGFTARQILCTGKWIELFTRTGLAFNLHFEHIGMNLRENGKWPKNKFN